jgi:hypothetical protein
MTITLGLDQHRAQITIYSHHGVQRHRPLVTAEKAWLEVLELPGTTRLQIDVALRMVDQLLRKLGEGAPQPA